ncbi:hypothetical protein KFE26_21470 [Shewanella sp. M16]|uniref:hypothetical protein n=1 Tax=Shewanella sp. M16 TaxID=2830837 RepID=UPI001BAF0DCC|nr:hypothetical protein [Shewanella sp. M16]MBS0044840.1 hypothetical protein [Shewanella sp. M16]
MKSITLSIILLLSLASCQSAPPPPPEPEGDKTSVNPPIVYLIDLYQKGESN